MSEYTAEDFAQASFARHPDLGLATRDGGVNGDLWMDIDGDECDDSGMALYGWTPVVEADGPVVTEGTLRHVEERAERKRERLSRHISDLEGTILRRGAALEDLLEKLADAERRAELAEWTQDKVAGEANDLRQEVDRLERILQAPLSLRDLEVAWEAAEEADECNVGDVLIIRDDEDNYLVRRMDDRSDLDSAARILSRAPREPWADLADSLEAEVQWIDRFNAVDAAQALYALGWRKGGDDDE